MRRNLHLSPLIDFPAIPCASTEQRNNIVFATSVPATLSGYASLTARRVQ